MWSTSIKGERLLVIALIGIFQTNLLTIGQSLPCTPKDFGRGSIVCVCNSTYCDEIDAVQTNSTTGYLAYTSTKNGKRFQTDQRTFQGTYLLPSLTITINRERRQTILGFGGAFTDAAGININSLSNETKNHLLRAYYSPDGIEYTVGRVPIAGSDFSTRPYTYNDDQVGDFNLTHFKLATEDFEHKIPLIKMAQNISGGTIKLFGSSWSAPAWMKTNGALNGRGFLKGEPGGLYYQTWGDYYVRFLNEYGKSGIHFWGLTTQNEPLDGHIPLFSFNCMGFTAETMKVFIENNLGPALVAAGYGDIHLMTVDDQRYMIPEWANTILANNSTAAGYIKGIGSHWYSNNLVGPNVLDWFHDRYPDVFILPTEACEGSEPLSEDVILGSWERGENYAKDIIQNLNHWGVGWVDWNIALNQQGGPNWANNFVDSPIIVDAENDQFYKQPMFYALGHFSKWLPPGTIILSTVGNDSLGQIYYVAAEREDKSIVLIVLNRSVFSKKINVIDSGFKSFGVEVSPNSIQTFIWQRN